MNGTATRIAAMGPKLAATSPTWGALSGLVGYGIARLATWNTDIDTDA